MGTTPAPGHASISATPALPRLYLRSAPSLQQVGGHLRPPPGSHRCFHRKTGFLASPSGRLLCRHRCRVHEMPSAGLGSLVRGQALELPSGFPCPSMAQGSSLGNPLPTSHCPALACTSPSSILRSGTIRSQLFSPTSTPPLVPPGEIKAQRGRVPCARSHSNQVSELRPPASQPRALSPHTIPHRQLWARGGFGSSPTPRLTLPFTAHQGM